jgi:hypothetical protein
MDSSQVSMVGVKKGGGGRQVILGLVRNKVTPFREQLLYS